MNSLIQFTNSYLSHKNIKSIGFAMILIVATNSMSLRAEPQMNTSFPILGIITGSSSQDGDSIIGLALHIGDLESKSPVTNRSQVDINFGLGSETDYIDIDGVKYIADRTGTQTEIRYFPWGKSLHRNAQFYVMMGFTMVYAKYWSFSFKRSDNNVEEDSSNETLAGEVAKNQAGRTTKFQIGPAATVGLSFDINGFGFAAEIIAEPILIGSDLSRQRLLLALGIILPAGGFRLTENSEEKDSRFMKKYKKDINPIE